MSEEEVRRLLAATVNVVGGGKVMGHMVGLSQPHLSMVVNGKRPIPKRVLEFLGIVEVKTYERKR